MMRSAARRNESANYMVTVSIRGDPPTGAPASDAKKPGTPYHATGQVRCSIGTDLKGSSLCEFGVIRGQPGRAEVHVTAPGGELRVIRFTDEVAEAPYADVKLTAKKTGDFELCVIPEAVITGG
ncbi:MAG: hypothetical protein JJE01_07410 [Gemmatimonadetes bacterium]|nr:hypothetical protein [Gemmatimonadota bacterium]